MGLTEDPISSAFRGAVAGGLDWSTEHIAALADRLRNRELAFVRNPDLIDIIRSERKGEEWTILGNHVRDKRLRVLVVMGLALRKLEKRKVDAERLQELRSSIHDNYGKAGLRAAELVQRGVVTMLLARFLRSATSPADVSNAIERLLRSVDKHAVFVQQKDSTPALVRKIVAKIRAQSPDLFIILGYGQARAKAKAVTVSVLRSLGKTYGADTHESAQEYHAFVGELEEGELVLTLPL